MDGGGRIAPGAAIENNAGAVVESDAGSQSRGRVFIWLFLFQIRGTCTQYIWWNMLYFYAVLISFAYYEFDFMLSIRSTPN
jgi:hypothetical protein